MADSDAKEAFKQDEVFVINPESPSPEGDRDKIVYIFKKDLEWFLAGLKPELHEEITDRYDTKPERAYHFVKRLLAKDDSNDTRGALPIRLLKRWIVKDFGDID